MINTENDLFLVFTTNSHEWTTGSSFVSRVDWMVDLLVVINTLPIVFGFGLASRILSTGSAEAPTGSK